MIKKIMAEKIKELEISHQRIDELEREKKLQKEMLNIAVDEILASEIQDMRTATEQSLFSRAQKRLKGADDD